jgi:hypothetical protein
MSNRKRGKKKAPKLVLALPDLEHAKTAVPDSLTSASAQRTYEHAIREFVAWYCSEPRLSCNVSVCGWATGSRLTRAGGWCTVLAQPRCVSSATMPWWPCSSDAGCGAPRHWDSRWRPSSSGRSIG